MATIALFVTSLDLPSWLEIHRPTDVKAKLVDVFRYALAVSVVILGTVGLRWPRCLAEL